MEVLGTVGAFLGVIVVLILVHELGHFVAAKRAGITVEEFGIGFPPRAASVRWRGTRYSLNWVPLGGFVKMLGENGEIEAERLRDDGLSEPEIAQAMDGAFNTKPIPVRLLVLVAGVLMNFLLAGVLFSLVVSMPVQVGHGPLTVTEIQENSPADRALEVDDVIVAADGQTFERSRDLTGYVAERAGYPVTLDIVRDREELQVVVIPRSLTDAERARGLGPIGFGYEPESYREEPSQVRGPVQAAVEGFSAAGRAALMIPGGLAEAIGGVLGLGPDPGLARGPIGIAEETGRVLETPLANQLFFVGILSVNLAVLNVLPFPPLDGGRIAVVLIEAVRRGRKLPAEREALIYLTGFVVLIALVILISIQDIQRLVTGGG